MSRPKKPPEQPTDDERAFTNIWTEIIEQIFRDACPAKPAEIIDLAAYRKNSGGKREK
jgi:hypothetical protein